MCYCDMENESECLNDATETKVFVCGVMQQNGFSICVIVDHTHTHTQRADGSFFIQPEQHVQNILQTECLLKTEISEIQLKINNPLLLAGKHAHDFIIVVFTLTRHNKSDLKSIKQCLRLLLTSHRVR